MTRSRTRGILCGAVAGYAIAVCLAIVCVAPAAAQDVDPVGLEDALGLIEVEEELAITNVASGQVRLRRADRRAPQVGGVAGICPQTQITHSSTSFQVGGSEAAILQAGMVEGEQAALSFTLDPADFPLTINSIEVLWGQTAAVQTTTQWAVTIWEGTPQSGQIVDTFTSDDLILPHVVMSGVDVGTILQFSVDPGDPEQIFVTNNGSNTFSVGFTIVAHNDPPTAPCFLGLLPAMCCPPPPASNAFLTNDVDGLQHANDNWLYCLPGCDLGGLGCIGGWHRFSELGDFQPSGDWNIRATYTPNECVVQNGACCLLAGGCEIRDDINCPPAIGIFQGDGTDCLGEVCTGACCFFNGSCFELLTETDCASEGVYLGNGTTCSGPCESIAACCLADGSCVESFEADCTGQGGMFNAGSNCGAVSCPQPPEACCFVGAGCLNLNPVNCAKAGAFPQGTGTDCGTITCFPIGACCLPNGACAADTSPEDCTAMAGEFQGDESDCGTVVCPQPEGACCFDTGFCLALTEDSCGLAGASWAGALSTCPDACEASDCPTDLDSSGTVDVDDLVAVILDWGGSTADVTGDGMVNVDDLVQVILDFGPCD